jgi:hypothetical protein
MRTQQIMTDAALTRGRKELRIVLAPSLAVGQQSNDAISVALSHAWLGDVGDFQRTRLLPDHRIQEPPWRRAEV